MWCDLGREVSSLGISFENSEGRVRFSVSLPESCVSNVSSQILLQSNTVDKSHSYQHRFTCVSKWKYVCVSRLEELLSMKCPYYPRLHGDTMLYLSKSIYY